jgi:hypothetical protein
MRRHHPLLMFGLSFAMAFLFAVVWTIPMFSTSPASAGVDAPFMLFNPSVFCVMSFFASISAVLIFPIFYFSIRYCDLPKSVFIIVAVVVSEILLVTPMNHLIGFIGSFIAFGAGILIARAKSKPLATINQLRVLDDGMNA